MSTARTAGFFTLGVPPERYHLPHPRLGLPVILLIRRVLIRALELLRDQHFRLADATEDEVTAALLSTIENDLRQAGTVAGFNKRTYEPVVRQGQCANYNGAVLTKTPDMCFKLRHDEGEPHPVIPEFDALFVECKPVDASHPAGSKYCDDGLIRFVRGDYAWAMQEGMMLAFARNGRTIGKHLIPAMSESTRMKSLHTLELPTAATINAAAATDGAEAVHTSRHKRSFPWLHGKGPATDITIYHLWHDCG
ncbi:MAG: hypothetical protein ABIS50_12805 [Luteolibacter sp.]|uniref:hypothetical protein n=1 Tax=Luteolibacter sp. TaxID=1962973 RepID=UPI003262FF82